MTGRAPRASDIAGATWFAPWPIAAFAVAATITAATTTGHDPTVMVAGVIGIAGFVTLLLRVEWGIIAMAAFAILRLADVATDFHGAPSLFQPLVAVIVCGIGLRWLATGARPAGGWVAQACSPPSRRSSSSPAHSTTTSSVSGNLRCRTSSGPPTTCASAGRSETRTSTVSYW